MPDIFEWLGRPTGSAMPLMWAHAKYIKLLRSTADGKVYDAIPEVAERYQGKPRGHPRFEIWKPTRHVRFMRVGELMAPAYGRRSRHQRPRPALQSP